MQEGFEPGLEEKVVVANLIVLNTRTLILHVANLNEMLLLYMSHLPADLPNRSILLEMIKYSSLRVFDPKVTWRLIDVSTTKAMHTPVNALARAQVGC